MAPFYKTGLFGDQVSLVIAFVIGISFGFWLERAGFGSSKKLAAQFYFTDMTVLKVMFTAILTAMIGLMFFSIFGWLDLSLLYINPTYIWPQIIGGLILGVGFVIGGYCPGTSIVASATGKIDGYFFVAGTMAGMLIFGEVYTWIESFHKSGKMGTVLLSDWLNISMGLIGFGVILMALAMFWGGEWLEKKFSKQEVSA
jgi:hypothetical protein